MKNIKKKGGARAYARAQGFTLIEVIIYIGLSSLLLTGVMVSTFQLIDGNKWFFKYVNALVEGNFVLQKMAPLTQDLSQDDILNFEIYLKNSRLWLVTDKNTSIPQALTTIDVVVENLEFTRVIEKNAMHSIYFSFLINNMKFKKIIWLK